MSALLAVLLLVPAADSKPKELTEAAKKEVKKFEGQWKAVKSVKDGTEETPRENADDVFIDFEGPKLRLNGMPLLEITAVDPSTTPKCIDFKTTAQRGPLAKGTALEAIYKLDGDTLVLALYPEGGAQRPTKFESPKGSKVVVVTFERVKK